VGRLGLSRLRHAGQTNGREASQVILLNSQDGTSSHLSLRVCSCGLACGDTVTGTRMPQGR